MRTFAHIPTSPPARLALDIGAATVTVYAEDRPNITVTLTPESATDTVAAGLIERAVSTVHEDEFRVTVPRAEGAGHNQTTVVRSDGHVRMVSRSVGPGSVVIGSVNGVTVVNGQVISGPGVTVVGGSGGMLRAEVRVPLLSGLVVRTDYANVTTHAPLAGVAYESVAGDLVVDAAAILIAKTMSGDIDAEIVGNVNARTTSGDIRIGSTQDAGLASLSGDLRVRDAHGPVRAKATSGDISVHVTVDARVTAESLSGDVRVTHAPGVRVDARLKSLSGRVRGPKADR